MLKDLVKLANDLDVKGFAAEADALDEIILEAQAGLIRNFKSIEEGTKRASVGNEKESLTDIAVRQEKEKKMQQLYEERYQKLLESAAWFSEKIWKSEADKFPVETTELYVGVKSIPWDPSKGYPRIVGAEKVIIPEGTVFDDMTSKKPTKDGGSISLGEAGSLLEKSLAETKRRLGR